VFFSGDNTVLIAAQAACVALPAAGLPRWLDRFRTVAWALILPLSIAVVIAAIAAVPSTANVLTWVAFLLVPPGCALALGWAMHGARPWLAVGAAPLLALAWAFQDKRIGQAAALVLVAGSCVTIGRLLAGGAPLEWLKLGIVAMAVIDSILVFTNQLQQPNATLVLASPGLGLPRLQSVGFGGAGMGYGDLFIAGVLGGVHAAARARLGAERGIQLAAAIGVFAVSLAWDQMFLAFDLIPATVPVAVVLVLIEGRRALRRARAPA
jgi:hypothetical protein